jgi:hypothetical protein
MQCIQELVEGNTVHLGCCLNRDQGGQLTLSLTERTSSRFTQQDAHEVRQRKDTQ